MLATAHTLIGLPLGVFLENPWLVFVLAFLLHLAADSLPHWNIDLNRSGGYPIIPAGIDVALGLFASWWLTGQAFFTPAILAAVIGSNLPDALHAAEHFWHLSQRRPLRWTQLFFKFHHHIQWELTNIPRGLVAQIIIVAFSIYLVVRRIY